MNQNIIQVNIERTEPRENRIRDAKNYDGWDDHDLHTVVLDPAEITIEGTPKAIRWLHDLMSEMMKDWRIEGEQWNADVCEYLAGVLWDEIGENPPRRQRTKRLR